MSCALLQTSAHAPSPSEPRVRGRVSSRFFTQVRVSLVPLQNLLSGSQQG